MIIQFLPLLLAPLLYALFAKLGAFLFRRTQLRWLHAIVFGVLVLLVGGVSAATNRMAGKPLPIAAALLLGLAILLLLGGWYLGPRAKTADGSPLRFKGGLMLSLVIYGLFLAVGLVAVLLPLLWHAPRA
jgi:hypothetical protein